MVSAGRRAFVKFALVGGGIAAVGVVGRFLYPTGFGVEHRTFRVDAADIPEPGGQPYLHKSGVFYLANLRPRVAKDPPQTCNGISMVPEEGAGGLVAVSTLCTHLHCSVTWRFRWIDDDCGGLGVLDCPCHGSKFTIAGTRLFGPAPVSLSTGTIRLEANGDVQVDMSSITPGARDNYPRAVPYRSKSLPKP